MLGIGLTPKLGSQHLDGNQYINENKHQLHIQRSLLGEWDSANNLSFQDLCKRNNHNNEFHTFELWNWNIGSHAYTFMHLKFWIYT
jgi:hypothetical protein